MIILTGRTKAAPAPDSDMALASAVVAFVVGLSGRDLACMARSIASRSLRLEAENCTRLRHLRAVLSAHSKRVGRDGP